MVTKQRQIILLGKNKIDFYSESTKKILRLELPPEVFNDLEIVNEDQAFNYVTNFIQTNKIPPSEAVLLIGDQVMFQGEIQKAQNTSEERKTIEEYVNKIPFEESSYKTYPSEKSTRILVANKSAYDLLRKFLEKNQVKIHAVVPLSDFAPLNTNDLTQSVIQKISKKFDSLRKDQLLSLDEQITSTPEESVQDESVSAAEGSNEKSQKKITKRVLILIGVFTILLLVLIVMVLNAFVFSNTATPQDTTSTPLTEDQQPSETPTPEVTIVKESASILIVSQDLSDEQIEELESLFLDSGFTTITRSLQDSSVESTFIVFKPQVPISLQEETVSIVENIFEEVSTRVSTDSTSDITIFLP